MKLGEGANLFALSCWTTLATREISLSSVPLLVPTALNGKRTVRTGTTGRKIYRMLIQAERGIASQTELSRSVLPLGKFKVLRFLGFTSPPPFSHFLQTMPHSSLPNRLVLHRPFTIVTSSALESCSVKHSQASNGNKALSNAWEGLKTSWVNVCLYHQLYFRYTQQLIVTCYDILPNVQL